MNRGQNSRRAKLRCNCEKLRIRFRSVRKFIRDIKNNSRRGRRRALVIKKVRKSILCTAFELCGSQIFLCKMKVPEGAKYMLCDQHYGELMLHHLCPECNLFVGVGNMLRCDAHGNSEVCNGARSHIRCSQLWAKERGLIGLYCLHCHLRVKKFQPRMTHKNINIYCTSSGNGTSLISLRENRISPFSQELEVYKNNTKKRSKEKRDKYASLCISKENKCLCVCTNDKTDNVITEVEQMRSAIREYMNSVELEETVICHDISHGKETRPIPVVVDTKILNDEIPIRSPFSFKYVTENQWLHVKCFPQLPKVSGCECNDGCQHRDLCHCFKKEKSVSAYFDVNGLWYYNEDSEKALTNRQVTCRANCMCHYSCETLMYPSQTGIHPPLVIFWSRSCGWGVRTSADIKRGTFIGEYVGEVIDGQVLQKLRLDKDSKKEWRKKYSYAFMNTEKTSIVASDYGNYTRFLNHSCKPNMMHFIRDVYGQGDKTFHYGKILFYASQDIKAEDELTINYGVRYFKDLTLKCSCSICTTNS